MFIHYASDSLYWNHARIGDVIEAQFPAVTVYGTVSNVIRESYASNSSHERIVILPIFVEQTSDNCPNYNRPDDSMSTLHNIIWAHSVCRIFQYE